jgi:hypothetical protein
VTVKISKIVPKDSAVLIYTPSLADRPIRFNGPETVADVPVEGHEMYYQAVLGCRDFQLDFLGLSGLTDIVATTTAPQRELRMRLRHCVA